VGRCLSRPSFGPEVTFRAGTTRAPTTTRTARRTGHPGRKAWNTSGTRRRLDTASYNNLANHPNAQRHGYLDRRSVGHGRSPSAGTPDPGQKGSRTSSSSPVQALNYPQEQGCRSVGRRHPLRPWRRSTRACRSILRSQRFSSGRSCGTLRPKSPLPCWSGDPQVPVALGPISRRASDPSRSQDRTWMLSGSGAGTGSAS
jgi:hypothetical protein